MKKISIIALTLVLTAGLMTACRAPAMDETSNPTTEGTTPSSTATTPTTAATTPATVPTPSGTDGATEGTGGINTMDPTESMPGKNRGMAPRR